MTLRTAILWTTLSLTHLFNKYLLITCIPGICANILNAVAYLVLTHKKTKPDEVAPVSFILQ